MPALITHDFFGHDLCAKGYHEAEESPDQHLAFLLGNQGPDPLFYAVVLAPRLRKYNKLGSRMHRERTSELLATMKSALAQLPAADRPIATAYAHGFLCHYALDTSMHPLVYFWQDSLCDQAEGISRKDRHEVHAVIESELDEMVLHAKTGTTIAQFAPQQEILRASTHVLDIVSTLYEIIAWHMWGLTLPPHMFKSCVWRFRLSTNVLHSPGGKKRRALGKLEESVRPFSFLRAMSHRAIAVEDSPFANNAHGEWTEPATGTVRTDSFWDIYEDAQAFAVVLITAFDAPGFDEAAANKLTVGRGFDGAPFMPVPTPPTARQS